MNTKTILRMTTSERAMGRYMRAPDHTASGGDGEAASSTDTQGGGKASEEALTTEQKLEKEFGQPITPATDDDSGATNADAGDKSDGDDEDDDDDDSGKADDSGAEGDDDGEGEAGEDDDQDPDKRSRAQKRIDDLTAAARENERQAAEAKRDADYWKRRAEDLGAKPDAAGEDTMPEEPDPSKFEYGEADLDYIKQRAKYDAKMEIIGEQTDARFKSQAATLEAKWNDNVATAKKEDRYPDFEEVVVQGSRDKKWDCSAVLAVGIKDSDYGVDIAYELASNPSEATRISNLTPLEQAREFGRLEERHHAKSERAKRKAVREAENLAPIAPTDKRVSRAPKPPTRQIRGGGGKYETPADTDDFGAFERMADQKLGIKGK